MSELLAKDLREGVEVIVDGTTIVGTLKVPPAANVSLNIPVDDTVGTGTVTPADIMDAVAKALVTCASGIEDELIYFIHGGFPDTEYDPEILVIHGGFPDTEYDPDEFAVIGGTPFTEYNDD